MYVSLDDFRARLAAEEGAEVAWLRTRRGAADRRDLAVVRADVPRTHWHRMAAQSAAERAGHTDRLYRLIVDFLEIHPHTRYVQGFHALAEVALLLLGDDAPLLLHRMYRLGHVRHTLLAHRLRRLRCGYSPNTQPVAKRPRRSSGR